MNPTSEKANPYTNETNLIYKLPFPSTLPFHINDQISPNYELVAFYQIFSMGLFGWYLGNSDSIMTGLILQTTAQLKIATNAIQTVVQRATRRTWQVSFGGCVTSNSLTLLLMRHLWLNP